NNVDMERFRGLGMPAAVDGLIQEAQFTGAGTRNQPQIRGTADVRNLSFKNQRFTKVDVTADSKGSIVKLNLDLARNLSLTADIDAAQNGYPFKATATFTTYPIEKLIAFNQGSVTVSGKANLAGRLSDYEHLEGEGTIDVAHGKIQEHVIESTKPFT